MSNPNQPEAMNDADNYAFEHGFEYGDDYGLCPDCGGTMWWKCKDIHAGSCVEVSVCCTNCGFNDVRYDC